MKVRGINKKIIGTLALLANTLGANHAQADGEYCICTCPTNPPQHNVYAGPLIGHGCLDYQSQNCGYIGEPDIPNWGQYVNWVACDMWES